MTEKNMHFLRNTAKVLMICMVILNMIMPLKAEGTEPEEVPETQEKAETEITEEVSSGTEAEQAEEPQTEYKELSEEETPETEDSSAQAGVSEEINKTEENPDEPEEIHEEQTPEDTGDLNGEYIPAEEVPETEDESAQAGTSEAVKETEENPDEPGETETDADIQDIQQDVPEDAEEIQEEETVPEADVSDDELQTEETDGKYSIHIDWRDWEDFYGNRPEQITGRAVGTRGEFEVPLTFSDENGWTATTDLPDTDENGNYIRWYISLGAPRGYSTGATVYSSAEQTDYTVPVYASTGRLHYQVNYNDNFNRFRMRTDDVMLAISTENGAPLPPAFPQSPFHITNGTGSGTSSGTSDMYDLPRYGYNLEPMVYDVNAEGFPDCYVRTKTEKPVSGYVNGKDYIFDFTLPVTNVSAKVVWVDEDNYRQNRPADVVLTLYANGEPWNVVPQYTQALNPSVTTATGYTWEGLPALDKDGNTIHWSVKQNSLTVYDTEYSESVFDDETNTWNQTVTNVLRDDWNYSLDLKWDTPNPSERYDQNIVTTSTSTIRLKYALNISTNSRTYEIGELKVRLPYALWKYRNGNVCAPSDISVPQWPEKNSQYSFSYQIDKHDSDDPMDWEIVYLNNVKLETGTNQTLSVFYDVSPLATIDLSEASFTAIGSGRGDGQSEYEEQKSQQIHVRLDTGVSLREARKTAQKNIYSKQSIGYSDMYFLEDFDPDQYHYELYFLNYTGYANQVHERTIFENPGQGGRVVGLYSFPGGMNVFDLEKSEFNVSDEDGNYHSAIRMKNTAGSSFDDRIYFLVAYPKTDREGHVIPPGGEATDTWHYTNEARIQVHASDDDNCFEHPEIDDRNDLAERTVSAECDWVDYVYHWDGEIYSHYKRMDSNDELIGLELLKLGQPAEFYAFNQFTVNGYEFDKYTAEIYDSDLYWNITAAGNYADYIRMTPDDYSVHRVSFTVYLYQMDRTDGQQINPEVYPEGSFVLWGQKPDGSWEQLDEWIQTDYAVTRSVDMTEKYTGLKVTTPELHETKMQIDMWQYMRIEPASAQLQEWLEKRESGEISFSSVNVLNFATYRMFTVDEEGNKVWYNPAADNQSEPAEKTGLTLDDIAQYGSKAEHKSDTCTFKDAVYTDTIRKAVYSVKNDTVHSKVDVVFNAAAVEYTEFRNMPEELKEELSIDYGEFFDLLPVGYELNESAGVIVRGPDNKPAVIESIETFENWRGSNRTLVKFKVRAQVAEGKNTGERIMYISVSNGTDVVEYSPYHPKVFTGFSLEYTASISWTMLSMYRRGENIVAFQGEDARPLKGSANYYSETRFKDDGSVVSTGSYSMRNAVQKAVDQAGTNIFVDINEDGVTDVLDTMYSYADVNPDVAQTVEIGIAKEVKGISGVYQKTDYAALGKQYSYRISLTTSDGGVTDNIILYDILEDAANTEGHHDETSWKGTFAGVKTSVPQTQGIAPVIYYSTVKDLDYNDITDPDKGMDISNAEIWTTDKPADEDITAVAFDLRKGKDGNDFRFKDSNATYVEIMMKAPEDMPEPEYAFNRPAYSVKYIPNGGALPIDMSNIGSRVDIKVVRPQTIVFHKTGQTKNADGTDGTPIPLGGTEFNLYMCTQDHEHSGAPGTSGSCWGNPLRTVTTAADGRAVFENLMTGTYAVKESRVVSAYSLSRGYWVFEVNAEEGTVSEPVRMDSAPEVTKEEDGSYTLLNMIRTTYVRAEKTWDGIEGVDIPPTIIIDLLQNEKVYMTFTMQTRRYWKTVGAYVPEYDLNGDKYNYRFVERDVEGFVPTYSGGANTYIKNTYEAKGSLVLEAEKTVNHRTPATSQVFTFVLEHWNGRKWETVEEVQNDGRKIEFSAVERSLLKTGSTADDQYRIYEKADPSSMYALDKTVYYADVHWEDQKDHTLKATYTIHRDAEDGETVETMIFNNTGFNLPRTGGPGTVVLRLTGLTMILAGVFGLRFRH